LVLYFLFAIINLAIIGTDTYINWSMGLEEEISS